MNAFLNEGGFDEEQKKNKDDKEQDSDEIEDSEEEKHDVTPDENMCGSLVMEKTKLNGDGGGAFGGLISGVGDIARFGTSNLTMLKSKPFFAIKQGILYQYEKEKSREANSKFEIRSFSAISVDK
mmetsp:Transcript_22319/g.15913  ORF Transcript_22319/g.15913 Transcript_22319/m.15913 type:complete len:125 (+) Transcript_22319:711-1085(+)|eukprot:CAMPEP_0116875236 /NCGR_PEP_ID=MMETSP0463-20121206/7078_1 /TAXON_ID=181622 /ORGANISM="Strombidinopsis sp, Strain SopsisLIS2011" /LENGTH=124 /DNA_ID=CAMNT_0004520439 /DNA_START=695 /DNA_END=1069 /DNA_ORIENTATION=-